MATCDKTDDTQQPGALTGPITESVPIAITQRQAGTLARAITAMTQQDTPPFTIVDFVSTSLNMPTVGITGDNNYSLLTCISSCIYQSTLFTPPTTFFYPDKDNIITCTSLCLPEFPSIEPSNGGGAVDGGGSSVANLEMAMKQQEADLKRELDFGLDWLFDILERAFLRLSQTLLSYGVWIATLIEHLAEMTLAAILERIGEIIRLLFATLKAVGEWILSVLRNILSSVNPLDIIDSIVSGLKDIYGVLVDIGSNIGDYIKALGRFIKDLGDIAWDIKQIIFAVIALASQIFEIVELITWTYGRIEEMITAIFTAIDNIIQTFLSQIQKELDKLLKSEEFNALIDATVGAIEYIVPIEAVDNLFGTQIGSTIASKESDFAAFQNTRVQDLV